MEFRLIIQQNPSIEESECVSFWDNFDDPIEALTLPGYKIIYDEIITADLPPSFPIGFELQKR